MGNGQILSNGDAIIIYTCLMIIIWDFFWKAQVRELCDEASKGLVDNAM